MATRVVMDPTYPEKLDAAIVRVLGRLGDAVADDARRFVPVDTGRLREGIEVGPVEGKSVTVHSRRPDPNHDREGVPVFVEFGTRYMDAQPYMRPAVQRKRVV